MRLLFLVKKISEIVKVYVARPLTAPGFFSRMIVKTTDDERIDNGAVGRLASSHTGVAAAAIVIENVVTD
jgi:hypothetical protein